MALMIVTHLISHLSELDLLDFFRDFEMLWSGFDHRFILFKTSAVKKTLYTEPGWFF